MKTVQSTRVIAMMSLVILLYFGLKHWTSRSVISTVHSPQKRRNIPDNVELELQHLHLKSWMNSSKAIVRLEVFEDVLTSVDLAIAQHSLNPDIITRGEYQQEQMNEFCSRHGVSTSLPSDPGDLSILLKHLLYDDSKRLVVCYVPKNGCSNVKHMLLILAGELPVESARPGAARPPESVLKKAHSFTNLSTSETVRRLQTYHKVMIVRNPVTRLLSAYRNKLEPPLNFTLKHSFPESIKLRILQKYRKNELDNIMKEEGAAISLTFSEFLQYMTEFPLNTYNEHFMPTLNLCSPCAVRYNIYPNFQVLSYDMHAIMTMLDIPSSHYPTRLGHRIYSTDSHLTDYYGKVSSSIKERILKVFQNEIEFHYTLYPENKESYSIIKS